MLANLIEIIKQAAVEAVEASKPMGICFGTVVSVEPLKINVEQKLTLDSSFLILTSLVSDFDVDMTVDHLTEESALHTHEYKGKKSFKVHLGLKVGESVIMLRVQGGQKYLVLDRAR